MQRSLALLQESYGEGESDEEDLPISPKGHEKNNNEIDYSGKSKLSSGYIDNSSIIMDSFGHSKMILLVEDIPLPPDNSPDDSKSESECFIKEDPDFKRNEAFDDSVPSDQEDCTSEKGKESSSPSPDFQKNKSDSLIFDVQASMADDKIDEFQYSKSPSDHQNDLTSNQIHLSDVPSLPTDKTFNEKESIEDDKSSTHESLKLSPHANDLTRTQMHFSEVPSLITDNTFADKFIPKMESVEKEFIGNDKQNIPESSQLSSHADYSTSSQMDLTQVPSFITDDTLKDNMLPKLMCTEKESVGDDKSSISERSKSSVHGDDSSDGREPISAVSPLSTDDTSKKKLIFEFAAACLEGVEDDETSSSSDDSTLYDNKTDLMMSSESRSQTALASLHETYTDSEGEVESDAEEENSVSKEKYLTPSKESTPSSMDDTSKDKPTSKLVSYATEEGMDDEMSDSEDSKSSSDHQDDSSDSRMYVSEVPPLSPVTFHRKLMNLSKNDIQLPPEPKGRCSKSLQEKISELYEKRKQGKDMNASIQKRKDFRNPSIYEKLIQFCNIDEQGTNYPPEIYDPHCWGPESYYEELAKRQKEEMDKREKEKKERTKVEFISGTAKKTTSDSTTEGAKRKSKWDIGINQMPAAALKPATLITPTVLPVPTGTKPTVISAFGTISKKAKQ